MMPGYTMPPDDECYFRLALFSRRIRFLRHFQRILPLFFQLRELRFMIRIPRVLCDALNRKIYLMV